MKIGQFLGWLGGGLLAVMSASGTEITAQSPDGSLRVIVSYDRSEPLRYRVEQGGEKVLSASSLGLVIDGRDLGLRVQSNGVVTDTLIDERYSIYGHHAEARNYCRQYSIPLKGSGRAYVLQVRVYNDGVAFRYRVPGRGNLRIEADRTGWTLPAEAKAYWSDYTLDYEQLHQQTTFGEIPLGKVMTVPLTLELGGRFLAITEADCRTFPDMVVRRVENGVEACFPSTPEGWTASGEVISPWRAMMVANDLNELVNCDLVTNLCEAPASGLDFSWVRPGRVLWQWWSVGSPRMEDQSGWYDAAARLGWEYYLIDDGWRMWRQPGKDQWQCLKEVIDYGKSKGVESIVWVNSEEMRTRDSIRAYLEKVKETGAVGIKIDFIPEATPAIVRWYQDALEETYALRLLCNFHGCIKPSGLRRTWPHELTREAIRGHEFHISRYDRVMPKDQDAIKPFTRLLAGPADFTPTAFVPEELLGYTWPHELAQAIVYLSPLTHFADNYIYYLNSPVEDLLRDLPVVWDETRVLPDSRIGKVAAFARRSGDEYWVGVVNGAETSSIELPFDDLKGPMMATVIADREGVDDAVVRTLRVVSPGDRWKITLRPGGGYVVRLQPIHETVEP